MSCQSEAAGLNNHGVDLLQKGSLWESRQTFLNALTCLNLEHPRTAQCSCRLLNVTEGCETSPNPTKLMEEAARKLLVEGKQYHPYSYEWIDCKPRHLVDDRMGDDGDAAAVATATAISPIASQRRHPLFSSIIPTSLAQYSQVGIASHDTRLPFLSFGAIQIHDNNETMMTLLADDEDDDSLSSSARCDLMEEDSCDCSVRWAVLYNLGLVCHILGFSMGERGHCYLHTSYKCYHLAQTTMPSRTPFADILHLLLSCQNNRMTIYQEFAMHRESQACLELLTFLLAVIPTYRSTGQLGPLEPSSMMDHEILLNLMVLVRTESAAAA